MSPDWTRAQTVPLERVVVSPEFVIVPLCSYAHKKSVVEFLAVMRTSLQNLQRIRFRRAPKQRHLGGPEADEGGVELHSTQRTTLADIFRTVQTGIRN